MATDRRLKQAQQRDAELVGRLLREFRAKAGLRQEDVAERLGRPQQYVSVYERGGHRLDLFELRMICRSLGVSLQSLVRAYEQARPRG